ncbi:phosphotransferase [Rhodobacterales bacterium HKCCE4037]|nr:phosphotransferase [Rhodobacterales bacterium HKCCE4037]
MIDAFLTASGWGKAARSPLASDASVRIYTRLRDGSRTAVLMQDPDMANLARFRHIGAHLRGLGLSAPETLAVDAEAGFALLEDFGDLTLARLLSDDPTTAERAYRATARLLPLLSAPPPDDVVTPGPVGMAEMTGLTFDLLPGSDDLRATLLPALAEALDRHAPGPAILSLRDVHAENLIWLPDRDGPARIGLLDYQDAMLLPDGYDLASLLDDPRREVPAEWRKDLVEDRKRIDILSLQRNLRILGIFHRLSSACGKPAYRAFLPRTRVLIARAAKTFPSLRDPVTELLDSTAFWGAA